MATNSITLCSTSRFSRLCAAAAVAASVCTAGAAADAFSGSGDCEMTFFFLAGAAVFIARESWH